VLEIVKREPIKGKKRKEIENSMGKMGRSGG